MTRALLTVTIVLLTIVKGLCCQCYGIDKISAEDYNSYDWIFIGRLIGQERLNTRENRHGRAAVYIVSTSYKGVRVNDTVRVYDSEDIASCGLGRLTIGGDYLVYAVGRKLKITSACTRTTLIPKYSWPKDSAMVIKLRNSGSSNGLSDVALRPFSADTAFLNKHILAVRKTLVQKFYDLDGKISAEGRYQNGLPEGFWKYYKGGKVVSKGKYINGDKDSLWVEPFSDKSVYIREYRAGEFTHKERFYFGGKLSSKTEPVGDGKKWVRYDYHSNGKLRYIDYCNPPKRDSLQRLEEPKSDGIFKMFNRKGIVLQEGLNRNGASVGHWKYYYESGKLRMEGDYIAAEKAGTWKIYYPGGQIKASGDYQGKEKTKSWKYYDGDGKELAPDPQLIKEDEDWFTYSGVKN
jgi:antitoxin component YwqK of YwqJK toxin-antitoxin module